MWTKEQAVIGINSSSGHEWNWLSPSSSSDWLDLIAVGLRAMLHSDLALKHANRTIAQDFLKDLTRPRNRPHRGDEDGVVGVRKPRRHRRRHRHVRRNASSPTMSMMQSLRQRAVYRQG
jgi:hypothetical protein